MASCAIDNVLPMRASSARDRMKKYPDKINSEMIFIFECDCELELAVFYDQSVFKDTSAPVFVFLASCGICCAVILSAFSIHVDCTNWQKETPREGKGQTNTAQNSFPSPILMTISSHMDTLRTTATVA